MSLQYVGLNEINALNKLITDFYLSDRLTFLLKFINLSKINKLINRNSSEIKSCQVFSTESLLSFVYNKNIIHYIESSHNRRPTSSFAPKEFPTSAVFKNRGPE